jgi:hypothetical protein
MGSLTKGIEAIPVDGRQSERAADIARGAIRLMALHGFACICELPLANGRRADIAALSEAGEIWIVEIKSCLEDFRTDQKWPEYRDFCDRLLFAVAPDFPREVLPTDTGLVIADRFSGEIVRAAPEHRLVAARRKAMSLRFARVAAFRLSALYDPEAGLELPVRE